MKTISALIISVGLGFGLASCAPSSATETVSDAATFSTRSTAQASDMERLGKLIGQWHPDKETMSQGTKDWLASNNYSDYYVRFDWGTEKQWMAFGDFRIVDGVPWQSGIGFVAFNPIEQQIVFREQGVEGASVNGSIKIISDNVFERLITVDRTDGTTRNRVDRWEFSADRPNCFSWMVTMHKDGKASPNPASIMCKAG